MVAKAKTKAKTGAAVKKTAKPVKKPVKPAAKPVAKVAAKTKVAAKPIAKPTAKATAKPKPGGALSRLANRAAATTTGVEREILIPLDKIRFDSTQPRKAFHTLDGRVAEKDEEALRELAASIDQNGLIEAITVQEEADGSYQIVVGERRTRAHLLLGRPTIRSIVRNDLKSPGLRLIYQLAENVNREDLTDAELASSIRSLMEGDKENGVEKMSQAEVAAHLGKSEGWVTRFVKYGDEELQRKWVQSGIADTVEKVYRLSILPVPLQVDILRRVALPEGDAERLEKPLNRSVIDALALEAKREKLRTPAAPAPVAPRPAVAASDNGEGGSQAGVNENEFPATGGVATNDAIGQALAEAAAAGRSNAESIPSHTNNVSSSSEYSLPSEARAAILGGAAAVNEAGSKSVAPVEPPVNCRITLTNVAALLGVLEDDKTLLEAAKPLRCDLSIPGPLAKQIANLLIGVIVADHEVPAVIQTELSKLA